VNHQNRIFVFGIGLRTLTRHYDSFTRSQWARPFPGQLIGDRLLDDGALEEARVVARVQHGGIGERELAEILFGDEIPSPHLEYLVKI
jgi:hypothetical protein